MRMKSCLWKILPAIGILLLLILDTNTATKGATAGLELCLKVIIPSLFPFFVVTAYLNGSLLGQNIPFIHRIAKSLHIPSGGDSILLLGLIGGYPVGAQLVAQSYHNRQINSRTGKILLGYCNNAGPALIFGISASMFSSKIAPFILWGIHILSALVTGYLLPRPNAEPIRWIEREGISLTKSLKTGLHTCAITCGWIIVFKIIHEYLYSIMPVSNGEIIPILITGIIEISNGCLQLTQLSSEQIRFTLASIFLSFGGVCVMMQTASVTGELGLGLYIPGKLIQTALSTILAVILSSILFPNAKFSFPSVICVSVLCILIFIIVTAVNKKYMANQARILYNKYT